MPEVVVIDYGMGNLFSVCRALEHCGAKVNVSADANVILSANRVVLPGVGAFGHGMFELKKQGLDEVVLDVAGRGTPLLGICLGMQMLLDESDEFSLTKGLGLVPGRVIQVPATTIDNDPQKIPHIGWNELVLSQGRECWDDTYLRGMNSRDAVYFVHSFMANPINSEHRIADCLYGGHRVAAVVGRDNVIGCQFHPEKSGEVGLVVMNNFLTV